MGRRTTDGPQLAYSTLGRPQGHVIQLLLVDLALILVLARLLGAAARRLGQPPVIGEILAATSAWSCSCSSSVTSWTAH
jgi:hypothetical protein